MEGPDSSRSSSPCSAVGEKETPAHRRIGFNTASGTVWFEFSAVKLKEYFYELHKSTMIGCLMDDISFSTVLNMSSMSCDNLENRGAFGSNLCAILDNKVKEESRLRMLRIVCGNLVHRPEFDELRQEVERMIEADLVAANIKWKPEHKLQTKVGLNISDTFTVFPP